MEKQNIFSDLFEKEMIESIIKLVDQYLLVHENQADSGFIKRENALKYFDDISEGTLIKYERLGLKRYQPIEKGTVFYSKEELNKFMMKFEI